MGDKSENCAFALEYRGGTAPLTKVVAVTLANRKINERLSHSALLPHENIVTRAEKCYWNSYRAFRA